MGYPLVTVICDKCGKEYSRLLREIEPPRYDYKYIYIYWLPKGWTVRNTEDGDGPEPEKVFVMCDSCEKEFKLTVRYFTPKGDKK